MNEEFDLGELATFRFDFTTTTAIQDTLSVDFGAYYNEYSALVFCGDPKIEYSEGDVELTFEAIDESIGSWVRFYSRKGTASALLRCTLDLNKISE